jgi:ketosteroid isomerase-like protein
MSDTGVTDKVGEVVDKAKGRFGGGNGASDVEGRPRIVREALLKLGDGDIDGFLSVLDDKVSWETPQAGNFPGGGNHEGTEAVKERFFADAGRTFTEFGFEPESYLDAGDEDAVVVLGRFVGKGVEGDNLDTDAVQIWEFQGDDTAIRVCTITDSAAFPEVVTEDKQKEFEEEDKEKEREEREAEAKKDDDKSESKSEDKSEAKGKDDSDDEKSKDDDEDDD